MPKNYISPISMDALSNLCSELDKNNWIKPNDYQKYHVKRGLRNEDGTGVMAGLTRICSVEGYYILDGERIPKDGKLSYRGYDINDIVNGCINEGRFGFEEVVWLLLFGDLPTESQLEGLREVIGECRELPDEFVEDMIMKHASKDIMNKMARCVIVLYSFDENPDDISVANVLRQSLQLISQMPTIMNGAYQIKRRTFYNKTMFLHPIKKEQATAEYILNQIRADKKFALCSMPITAEVIILLFQQGFLPQAVRILILQSQQALVLLKALDTAVQIFVLPSKCVKLWLMLPILRTLIRLRITL